MNKRKIARSNPWQRGPKKRSNPLDDIKNTRNYVSEQRVMGYVKIMEKYGSKERRFQTIFQNKYLDIFTKRVVLKASAAVVSIVSYFDEREIFHGSGTIIESDGRSGIILTSASLNGCPTDKNVGMDNVKVVVYLSDGKLYEGHILAYDFHYNLAAIKIQSNAPLPTASLRLLDDSITIDPNELGILEEKAFQLHPCSNSFNLIPGDTVIALGRYFIEPYEIMAAPGEFSVMIMTAKSFLEQSAKSQEEPRRLWHGMEVANLYVADLRILEKITQKFPNIFKGVLVEEVMRGSPADSAGILPDDVIIRCGGKAVQSFLEFFEIMWDNAGCPVELVAIRASADNPLYLTMVAVERSRDKFYRWPHWGFECKCEDGH